MTIEQFKSTKFSLHQKVLYKGHQYAINGVDFEEYLIGIEYLDETMLVRCENCEILY